MSLGFLQDGDLPGVIKLVLRDSVQHEIEIVSLPGNAIAQARLRQRRNHLHQHIVRALCLSNRLAPRCLSGRCGTSGKFAVPWAAISPRATGGKRRSPRPRREAQVPRCCEHRAKAWPQPWRHPHLVTAQAEQDHARHRLQKRGEAGRRSGRVRSLEKSYLFNFLPGNVSEFTPVVSGRARLQEPALSEAEGCRPAPIKTRASAPEVANCNLKERTIQSQVPIKLVRPCPPQPRSPPHSPRREFYLHRAANTFPHPAQGKSRQPPA